MALKEIFEGNTSKVIEATELLKVLGDRDGKFVWKQLTAEGGDFVAFVTAGDEGSYPNKGTQDGYWYELVEEGVVGIDYGEVTPTATSETITVSHSLGVVPSQVYFIAKNAVVNGDIAMISKNIIGTDPGWLRSYYGIKPGKTSAPEGITITTISATDKTITHTPNIGANLQASKTYYWIAIA